MNDAPDTVGDFQEHGRRPAATSSPLAEIRKEREEVARGLYTDLRVPRYTSEVYVRYHPVSHDFIRTRFELREKQKKQSPNWHLLAHCDILANSCGGVYAVVDGDEVAIDEGEDWPVFGPRVAAVFDVDSDKATDAIRALYMTDGDIVSTAGEVMQFSGYSDDQIQERTRGN